MFYIVNKATRELVRTTKERINVDESINEFEHLIQLRHVEDSNIPTFDKATHKIERQFVDDDANYTRTFSFVAAPLSQAELTKATAEANAGTTRAQIKTAYTALQNGTGAVAERMARVERAVAFILREFIR